MSDLYELTTYFDEKLEKARKIPDGSTNRFIQAFEESISILPILYTVFFAYFSYDRIK
ncbi:MULTISPECIES: hypothetical protein [Bacillus cereus group]|uniref:hypothetical protein n=1 Tax=Bacillus cereus group TaxID=86661 RepID=UPI00159310B8|nr:MULTISPECIES: hypothetical protein [Bacillus cereus group]MCU5635363.1 hypothetical protein [Bacillus cereus]